MRLCQIVPSLEERHGGPSKSVRALADALASHGHDTSLLATAVEPAAVECSAAQVRVFPRRRPLSLYRSPELDAHLQANRFDCLHYHSLWLLPLRYATAACRRTRTPLVLSPRGMMTEWAWRHHRLRKLLAQWLVHPGAFATAAGWHATSAAEADDIRRLGFRQPVCVAPNGVVLPAEDTLAAARRHWLALAPQLRDRPVALFYSRFHRKKRLRELLELWQSESRGDWLLLLAGIPEEYGIEDIRGWVRASRQESVLVMDGRSQPHPYAVASLFLLPSHSENFGLSIAEALAAGVPALVTDATPWADLSQRSAGWCVPWSAYPGALKSALAENSGILLERGRNGRRWMAEQFTWEASARLLAEFYGQLLKA